MFQIFEKYSVAVEQETATGMQRILIGMGSLFEKKRLSQI
jgi:uncharacterized iron-regulated protein